MLDWKPLGEFAEFPQRRTGHPTTTRCAVVKPRLYSARRASAKQSRHREGVVTVVPLAGAGGRVFGYNYWKTHHGSGAAASGAAVSTASPATGPGCLAQN
jgi:hypothetical protein